MPRLILALFAFLIALPAYAAPTDDFLVNYRTFLSQYNFTNRTDGVRALDNFFATNYLPDAKINLKHNTVWNLPSAEPKKFTADASTTPAGWKLAMGPQYEGQPALFPHEGLIESADVLITRKTASILETKERITAKYRLIPGTNWFVAAVEATCYYQLSGAKVANQRCSADIRISLADQ